VGAPDVANMMSHLARKRNGVRDSDKIAAIKWHFVKSTSISCVLGITIAGMKNRKSFLLLSREERRRSHYLE
jgi:hypothetical protein